MTNKLNYLNNEKRLYDYILDNKNEFDEIIANDKDLADILSVSLSTVFRWRKKLTERELISCKIKVINNKKQCIIKLRG